jgi:hypothetical protein
VTTKQNPLYAEIDKLKEEQLELNQAILELISKSEEGSIKMNDFLIAIKTLVSKEDEK